MNALKNILFKILRLIGIFALIYVCLLLYMVMSERRLAFPRAEIDDASESALRDNAVLCHVENDKKLQGWILNDSLPTTALYFADRGEDAATFLANAKRISGFRLVTFNYRGSAGSEGTPGEKYYDSDIRAMVGCAHSNDLIFIGHPEESDESVLLSHLKVLENAQIVGMILLFALLLYANANDIYRFFLK